MYVDDSGNPSAKDRASYYLISGVILHESNVLEFELKTQEYKHDYFKEYMNCEIHTHDIYKSRREFSDLTLSRKYQLLDSLYNFINGLPITVISVGIDKVKFSKRYSMEFIYDDAWTFLVERFDQFIDDNRHNLDEGIIIVDKSSKIPETEIWKIVRRLRKFGSNYRKINHLIEEPIFIDSKIREGIQIADATAYCSFRYLVGAVKFEPYWDIVRNKLRKGPGGTITGYGFKVFP